MATDEIADNVVAVEVEFDEDGVPALNEFEDTAMRFVGGMSVFVVIVREGGLGRFADMVGGALYHVLYVSEFGMRGKFLDAATFHWIGKTGM